MKDYFLGDSFDVGKKGTGVSDISFLVEGSISILETDEVFKF